MPCMWRASFLSGASSRREHVAILLVCFYNTCGKLGRHDSHIVPFAYCTLCILLVLYPLYIVHHKAEWQGGAGSSM